MSSVYPSGAALATLAPPAMPAAAPTFSITIDCPSNSPMRCAWIRALTSIPPPAAKGTMSVIGRVGQSCAAAWPLAAITIAAAAIIVLRMRVSFLRHIRAQRPRDQGRRCRGRIIVAAPRSNLLQRRAHSGPPGRSLGGRGHYLLSSRDADRKRTRAKGHDERAPTALRLKDGNNGGRISRHRPDGQGHGGEPAQGRTPGACMGQVT